MWFSSGILRFDTIDAKEQVGGTDCSSRTPSFSIDCGFGPGWCSRPAVPRVVVDPVIHSSGVSRLLLAATASPSAATASPSAAAASPAAATGGGCGDGGVTFLALVWLSSTVPIVCLG